MRSLTSCRHAVQSALSSTFLTEFRIALLVLLLAFALAASPITAHAVVPAAAHAASSSIQLADGNPPPLPCGGGVGGPC